MMYHDSCYLSFKASTMGRLSARQAGTRADIRFKIRQKISVYPKIAGLISMPGERSIEAVSELPSQS